MKQGTKLGDFELLRELGRGGMGVVYEARQVSLNRKVALKVLAGTLGLSSRAVNRFKREAEAAAKLHHTNIVPVYAIGEQDGTHFYAMELIDGPSLDCVLHQAEQEGAQTISLVHPSHLEPLGTAQPVEQTEPPKPSGTSSGTTSSGTTVKEFDHVASLIAEVAEAIEYAHEEGIVHRDIKPSNLLLGPNGKLSVNDFGLARVLEAPNMTATGEMLGTPAYMSPEQITAGRTPLDHRTDIYSLGATLYEMLTLQPPFQGERRDQVLAQILHKDPIAPRRINRRIPIDLETICLKAMDKDPDKRYQSAGQFAQDLERYVNRFEISARRVGVVGKTVKLVRRHPGLFAGAVSVTMAVAISAFFVNQYYRAEQARQIVEANASQELTRIRRDNAINLATIAATSGDLERAESAIQDAMDAGATSATVRLLRGQVDFFNGDFQSALVELQVAEELSPQSAAPKGLLALTYLHTGDRAKYGQMLETLNPIEPETQQDLLFKAYAYYWTRPDVSLELLRQNKESALSPLTRAIQADIRMARAEQQSDLALAELALGDIASAKEFLPENPVVLAISLWLHSVASNLYMKNGMQSQFEEVVQQAESDFDALIPWSHLPYPAFSMWEFRSRQGRTDEMLEIVGKLAFSNSPPSRLRYAMLLCNSSQFDEARKVLQGFDTSHLDGGWLKAYIEAELNPNDVSPAVDVLKNERIEARPDPIPYQVDTPREFQRRALLMLGKTRQALERYEAEIALGEISRFLKYEDQLLRFGAGQISEEEFERVAIEDGPWAMSHAYALIGLMHLSKGERRQALESFRKFRKAAIYGEPQLDLVHSFLDRMESDPNWPSWIPIKDESPDAEKE